MAPAPDETLLTIDKMALEGNSVGRIPGGKPGEKKVVILPYGAPGDTVLVKFTEDKGSYFRAALQSVKTPSPDRVEPPCPHFFQGRPGPWCGGCDWQHLSYPAELAWKKQLLTETLTRIGWLKDPPVKDPVPSPQDWRYRQKAQVPFGTSGGKLAFGFYAPGSHTLVEFGDCLVQPETSVSVLRCVRDCAAEFKWEPYEEDRGKRWLRHALLRMNDQGELLLTLVTRTSEFPQKEAFLKRLTERCPVSGASTKT